MPSTIELRRTLEKNGACRKQLQASWGAWADEFCDALLARLIQPKRDSKIHLWLLDDGQIQVNIDIGAQGAYTVDITSDPLKVIGARLNELLVCDTDSSET